jgi:hypothetical protein
MFVQQAPFIPRDAGRPLGVRIKFTPTIAGAHVVLACVHGVERLDVGLLARLSAAQLELADRLGAR